LPTAGALHPDRSSVSGPSSDGLAVAGLAAAGLPPLPGNSPAAQQSRAANTFGDNAAAESAVAGSHNITMSSGVAASAAQHAQGQFAPLPLPARSGRGTLLITFVLLTVAAVAIGVYVVRNAVREEGLSDGQSGQDRTAETTQSASAPAAVPDGMALVNPAGYTGRPATAVMYQLRRDGLNPVVSTVPGGLPLNPSTCTVTELRPSGTLPKGTAVTITCTQH
jgi:serine/threonine-protein kinase